MRIAIFGAGATGGFMAFQLAGAGHDVAVIARGDHLAAMRRDGLRVESGQTSETRPVRACAEAAEAGMQDAVIIGVKATGLPNLQGKLGPMIGPQTTVLFPQNGMPWWYPLGLPDDLPCPDLPIFGLKKGFLAELAPEQVVGGLLYTANAVVAPGVIHNDSPQDNRLDIGPVLPASLPRAERLGEVLEGAGFGARLVPDIRAAVWKKLVANMTGSLLALAVQGPSSAARKDEALGRVYLQLVREALTIAAASGYPLTLDPEKMLTRTIDHLPSILQDYQANRPMEIAEIALAPQAFARAAGIETPVFDTLVAIVTTLARSRGLA